MKTTKFIFSAFVCFLIFGFVLAENTFAQNRKQPNKKRKSGTVKTKPVYAAGIAVPSAIKREAYLSLEPCAKETPEQIYELENAADKNKQLEILVKRTEDKDDWLRACAVYRLGEFREAAQEILFVIIKLLHEEKTDDVWFHVEKALWKIPPNRNILLAERIRMSQSDDVYKRLYGIYALGYFKPPAGSFQAKDTLNALIESAKDNDKMVSWLSVTSIRQLGFYGIDTSAAIPVLSDILKSGKLNPENIIRAFVPMGKNALPAVPLLFEILYNPKKYIGETDKNNRSYGLYLTTAIALGNIGKPLLSLLEKEIEKEPFAILQVLSNVDGDGTLPIFFTAMKHSNPKVRKKAIERLPGLTSIGAVETLPHLLTALNDVDSEVRESAISKIGIIAKFTEKKSPELQEIMSKKAVPALIAKLKDKEASCYSALTLGDFGTIAEPAISSLVRLIKKEKGNLCAESALYEIGEKGRKFLTKEQIEEIEENKKSDTETCAVNYNQRNVKTSC